jgi:hypothetical protein
VKKVLPLALLFVPALASAQQSVVRGRGFPIGEKSRIHTHLDLAVGYDSNPLRATDSAADPVNSDWKAQIRPGLEVQVPGSTLEFSLRSKLMIEQLFGTNAASDTRFGGDVGADLRAGSSKSVVGLELKDVLARTPTFFADIGAVGADELRLVQWQNRGRINAVLRPGGGALEFRTGYGNELHIYDGLPDSQRHAIELEAKLKFLPKTAAVFAADLSFFSANNEFGTSTLKSTPYNVAIGLQGQVTPRLSTLLRVGFGDTLTWSDGFFSGLVDNANIRTIIASANFTYAFMPASSVTLGYDRLIRTIILLNSYTADSFSLLLKLAVGSRLAFGLGGQIELRNFADSPDGAAGPSAQIFTGDARVEYWFFEFLRGGLLYQIIRQNTDVGTSSGPIEEFTRHQGLLTVGFMY